MSEANEEIIRRAHKICPVTAIQNRYSMMYREYESLFPVLEELKIGFVAFSPLANGFLTGKYDQSTQFEKEGDYRKVMPQFSSDGIRENEKLMTWMKIVAEEKHATPAQIMLRWHIQRGIVVIPKSTHIERMEENFNVFDFALEKEDMDAISGLDKAQSSFFSHQDPNMVEWFVKMVEERKTKHDSTKEKKNW